MTMQSGVAAALTAALLFGAGTPFAKLLLGQTSPWMLAALLYLGSGAGLWVMRSARRSAPVALPRHEAFWLLGAVAAGGMAGPALLMLGLAHMPASTASLMLNAEGVLTALIAWFVFRENFDRRIALGMLAIVAGSLVLSWPRGGVEHFRLEELWPASAVLGACLAWAVDNNLTRKISLNDASWIAMVKGLVAGTSNLVLALALDPSTTLPAWPVVLAAGVLGFCQLWGQPDVVCSRTAPPGYGTHRCVFLRCAVSWGLACDRASGRACRCPMDGGWRLDGQGCSPAFDGTPRASARPPIAGTQPSAQAWP